MQEDYDLELRDCKNAILHESMPKLHERGELTQCTCCGLFVPRGRWIAVGSYKFLCGFRPVCVDCEE